MTRVELWNTRSDASNFKESDGVSFSHSIKVGEFGNASGVSITTDPDGNTMGLMAVYPELKSTDSALSALSVVAGFYSRMLVNKAQTADVSIYGAELQCRVKAGMAAGAHAGAWCYWEASGTETCAGEDAGMMASVESEAGLTAAVLSGIQITTAVHASATATLFPAIRVLTKASAKPFMYLIEASGVGTPATAVMKLTSVAGVAVATGTVTGTQAGALKIMIGTGTYYIQLYPTYSA